MVFRFLSFFILFILMTPLEGFTKEGSSLLGNWTIKPAISSGVVHEFLNDLSYFNGVEISLQYDPGLWFFRAGVGLAKYRIAYSGASEEAALNFLRDRGAISEIIVSLEVQEKREDIQFWVGREKWIKDLNVLGGLRRIRLINDFSSMEIFGPAIGLEWGFNWMGRRFILESDMTVDAFGKVNNHRDDFASIDGQDTISFYGDPVMNITWEALVQFQPFRLGFLNIGYEGSVFIFDHIARYFHGLRLQAEF